MIIEAPDTKYECISHVLHGNVNDAYICRILNSTDDKQYVLNVIYNREMAHGILEIIGNARKSEGCLNCFTWKENLCILFPYHTSRTMEKFYMPSMMRVQDCEEIFKNLVLTCISSQIPYPILYLILCQKRFNMEPDNQISINYCIDFEEMDETITEAECLKECISMILIFFDAMDEYNIASYQVIAKKHHRDAYHSFIELYQDLKNASLALEKDNIFKKLRRFGVRRKDTIFFVLKTLCIVMGVMAIIMILCQVLFGDIPFFRLFTNSFNKIGDREMWRTY